MYIIKAKANQSKRTFTIRKFSKVGNKQGKLITTYRTSKMSREEFEINSNNTQGDWEYFLRTSHDYYPVL